MSSRVCVVGATGRMGRALIAALADFDGLELSAAVAGPRRPEVGRDVGELAGGPARGVALSGDVRSAVDASDVVIDFSSAAALPQTLAACESAGRPLVVGTTGYDAATNALFDATSKRIPLLVAANTSLALNVLLSLVRQAAAALPAGYDIEIVEAHHRHKVDAPSGTALALGRSAAEGRGIAASPVRLTGSEAGARETGPIGYAVVRGGDVVGEHDVRFLGPGEQLRLSHIATDRAIFARGALTAARWLVGRAAGLYGMADVLALNSKG